jgi:hypothetical protein
MRVRNVTTAAAAVALLAVIATSRAPSATPVPDSSAVTCNASTVRPVIFAFTAAFNRGDQSRLRRVWSQLDFMWYSVTRTHGVPRTQATHYVTYDRASMLRYFRARHRQRETLRIMRLSFNGVSGGFGNFQYWLTRRALDLAEGAPELYHGKGAASCRDFSPRLAVWSMGRE